MSKITEIKPAKNLFGDNVNSALKSREQAANIEFTIEDITPEMADEMLRNSISRKAADPRAMHAYAKAMEADAWLVNGMPIIFDTDGRLIDGVQRLESVRMTGKTLRTFVAHNVHPDTLHTIDQHRRRSYTGVLESRGYRHAGSMLWAMSKLIRIDNGTLGRDILPISWSRYDRVLAANPEIVEAVSIAERFSGCVLHSTARPVLTLMAIKAGKTIQVRKFLSDLTETEITETSAASQFAFQLKSVRDMEVKIDVDHALALAIMAFNDYCDGKMRKGTYEWQPDYGKLTIDPKTRKPVETRWLKDKAPANLGMPYVDGYEGLDEARFDKMKYADEDFSGDLVADLKRGSATSEHKEAVRMMTVTPEMANNWLSRYNQGNRVVQKSHIAMIVSDIKNGQWMVNAQPICFTGDPEHPHDGRTRLLNGQHRLQGCVESGIAIEIPIAVNIDEAAFATYDVHAKKTLQTSSAAKTDDRVVRGAAKFQWRIDNGWQTKDRITPSNTDILNTIKNHPDMAEYFAISRKRQYSEIASAGVMTFFLYHINQQDKALAEVFTNELVTGENIAKGSPVAALRMTTIGQRQKKSRKDILTMLMLAWDQYVKLAEAAPKKNAAKPVEDDAVTQLLDDEIMKRFGRE